MKKVHHAYKGTGALSYADTIVLAGQTAVEFATGMHQNFCAGRTDAIDGLGSEYLSPRSYNDSNVTLTLIQVRDEQEISGLFPPHWVVLHGRLRSSTYQILRGYSGSWSAESSTLSNAYFQTLLNYTWQLQTSPGGLSEYTAVEVSGIYMTPQDVALIWDAQYLSMVQEYAANNTMFLQDFADAWTRLANIDRFNGPTDNLCNGVDSVSNVPTSAPGSNGGFLGKPSVGKVSQDFGIWVMLVLVLCIIVGFCCVKKNSDSSRYK